MLGSSTEIGEYFSVSSMNLSWETGHRFCCCAICRTDEESPRSSCQRTWHGDAEPRRRHRGQRADLVRGPACRSSPRTGSVACQRAREIWLAREDDRGGVPARGLQQRTRRGGVSVMSYETLRILAAARAQAESSQQEATG